MTQQEQQHFVEALEVSLTWMRTIQDILESNDNTQGPLDALEARLRETEKIHQSKHEGRIKLDMALGAAENLLHSGDEEMRNHTKAKLKYLKNLWEETCTYIIHCHSRIEWVWLHWSEYLKAYREFELWLTRQKSILDTEVELQLGLKEKLWQVSQYKVVVSDVHGQFLLLERLLDEAAALYNRTQDPSVEPLAQERLQDTYKDVRDRAEEHLLVLQKIAEDHQLYHGCVQRFQSWLLSKTKEITDLMDRESTSEDKLNALRDLADSVSSEEKTLQHIERVAGLVRSSSSPAGSEVVVEEAEELRLGWQRLRQGLCQAVEGLRSSLDSHDQYMARCQRLGEDIGRLKALLKGLEKELVGDHNVEDHALCHEDQLVCQWKKYTTIKNTLAEEESRVELLKSQLKDLFEFSVDSQHFSDNVLEVVKEHQSMKSRVTRLCSESVSELKNLLYDPLSVHVKWSQMVSRMLEASADVTDSSHITMLVQTIEHLLKDSLQLQECFNQLHVKVDLIDSVFSPEGSDGLQVELSAAFKNRELLHMQLLQRQNRLQAQSSRTKDFGKTYNSIHSKLAELQDQLKAADGLQPDILAKKSQLDHYRVIQKDLEVFEPHIIALETLVSSSQSNSTYFQSLYADWKYLHKEIRIKMHECEERISNHESFHDSLLNIEKWLMIMKQKLKSFYSNSGEFSIEGRQHEVERTLAEFPEKEIDLQHMEVRCQGVLQCTTEEGQIHILHDMKRLQDSWVDLYNMSQNLHRLLSVPITQTESVLWRSGALFGDNTVPKELIENNEDRAGCSISQHGQQHQPIESFGILSSLVHEDSLDGQSGEEVVKGGCTQGHAEGQRIPPGHDDDDDNFSGLKTYKDSEHFQQDEMDDLTWKMYGKASHGIPKDSREFTDREKTTEADGSNIVENRSVAALTAKLNNKDGARIHSEEGRTGHCKSRRTEFEDWLYKQNELLSGILSLKRTKLSAKDLKIRQNTVEALRAEVAWGQEQFQLLLQESQCSVPGPGSDEDCGLEELRYHWMLYKSKVMDEGILKARHHAQNLRAKREKLSIATKAQKKNGLMQRVCRLAFPLWLFLLALLVLAFMLPLMDEGNSCTLSNNLARSFTITLRYDGPPPT